MDVPFPQHALPSIRLRLHLLPYWTSLWSSPSPPSLEAGCDRMSQFWLMGYKQKWRMQPLGHALETGRPALPAHLHFGGLIPAFPPVAPHRTAALSHLGQWGQRMCLQDVEKSRRNLHYRQLCKSGPLYQRGLLGGKLLTIMWCKLLLVGPFIYC